MLRPLLILAVAAVMASPAKAAETLAAQGYVAALGHCAGCHGIYTAQASPHPGAPAFADVGLRYADPALELRILAVTKTGHYAMPPRRLTPTETHTLAVFIREIADRAQRNRSD